MKQLDAADPLGSQLTSLFQRTDVHDRERSYLQFAAGKFFDDLGGRKLFAILSRQIDSLAAHFPARTNALFFKDVIYNTRDLPSDQRGMESPPEVTPIFWRGCRDQVQRSLSKSWRVTVAWSARGN
jgi:hypothetical protein